MSKPIVTSTGTLFFVGGLLGLIGFVYSLMDSEYRRARFARLLSDPSLLSSIDPWTWALVLLPVFFLALGTFFLMSPGEHHSDGRSS